MGLDFAIDELYATGWSSLDSAGCAHHVDGRAYPTVDKVVQTFAARGLVLSIRHIQLFDCYRAEWRDAMSVALGAVVGQSEAEAAVYALSQMRRQAVSLPTAIQGNVGAQGSTTPPVALSTQHA